MTVSMVEMMSALYFRKSSMGMGSATGSDTSACPGSNFAGNEFTS